MRSISTLILSLLFLAGGLLTAQTNVTYTALYGGGDVESVLSVKDIIGLDSDEFGVLVSQNEAGSAVPGIGFYRIGTDGTASASFLDTQYGTALPAKASQAGDGSIWIAADSVTVARGGDQLSSILLLKISADLSETLASTRLDIPGYLVELGGLAVNEGNDVAVLVSLTEFDNTTSYVLAAIDSATGEISSQVPSPFPVGTRFLGMLDAGSDSTTFAIAGQTPSDSVLIYEIEYGTLAVTGEYSIAPSTCTVFSQYYGTTFTYSPGLGAYAIGDYCKNISLANTGRYSDSLPEVITAPQGYYDTSYRLAADGNNLVTYGRINFTVIFEDSTLIGTTEPFYPSYNQFANVQSPIIDSLVLTAYSLGSLSYPGIGNVFTGEQTVETIEVLETASSPNIIQAGSEISLLPSNSGDAVGTVALQRRRNGYETLLIDAETGEVTDTLASPDAALGVSYTSLPVRVGDYYLVTARNSLGQAGTVRYDTSFEITPFAGGETFIPYGEIGQDRFINNTNPVKATSYGMVSLPGAVFRSNPLPNAFNNLALVLTITDTTGRTIVQTPLTEPAIYPYYPAFTAVAADQVYVAGSSVSPDGIRLVRTDSTGIVDSVSTLKVAGTTTQLLVSMVLNDSGDRALISTRSLDTLSNSYIAYLLEVDTESGELLNTVTLPEEIVGSQSSVAFAKGVYDSNGNILVVAQIRGAVGTGSTASTRSSLEFFSLDAEGNLIFRDNIVDMGTSRSTLGGVEILDSVLFVTGNTFDNTEGLVNYLVRIDSDPGVVSTKAPSNLSQELSVTAFPNPTSGQMNFRWESQETGNYALRLFDVTGRPVQRLTGTLTVGDVTVKLELDHLPVGTYFARIDTPSGYLIKRISKQ